MQEIIKTTLIGLFFGTFGTTLGGILGVVLKRNSNKFLSFILALASGLMTSIICFELIPEALGISNITNVIIGIILGIIIIITKQIVTKKTIKLKITQSKIQIIMVVQMIGSLIQIQESKMFKEEFSL